MNDSEFWELTPREFYALADTYNQNETRLNYRAGLITSAVYNVARTKASQHVFEPMEFFARPEPEVEYDIDKLAQGVEYTLRMCEASLIES